MPVSLSSHKERRLGSPEAGMASLPELRKVAFGPDGKLSGFEAGDNTAPAVVFLQEWWGVTDIVKQQVVRLASSGRGFRVLVPDLYHGVVGVDMEEAGHLMTSLDFHRALEEVRMAIQHLLDSGSPKVGITGGCMGGALSFAAAQHVRELSCAVPFYGTPAREMPWIEVDKIPIPLQYHTGELDAIRGFSDPKSGHDVINRMRTAGNCPALEYHVYPNTAHSFLNALTPEGVAFLDKWGYGVPPADMITLAWDRMVAFLETHLRS